MRKTSPRTLTSSSSKRRVVESDFEGAALTSDAGLLLVRETDKKLGLVRSIARGLGDGRQMGKVRHAAETMLRQRVMGLCAGWERERGWDCCRLVLVDMADFSVNRLV
jgi:hypothetical protein